MKLETEKLHQKRECLKPAKKILVKNGIFWNKPDVYLPKSSNRIAEVIQYNIVTIGVLIA
jgi:hypothetical protein